MGILSFGAEVSIYESLKRFTSNASSASGTRYPTGWPLANGRARTCLQVKPSVISITPQRKVVNKHFRATTLIFGSLLLFLLLLCAEVPLVLTVGTAIRLVSRIYHQTNLDRRYSSGDGTDSVAQVDPGR